MFKGQYQDAKLAIEKVHWGSSELWEGVLREKIADPFQLLEE